VEPPRGVGQAALCDEHYRGHAVSGGGLRRVPAEQEVAAVAWTRGRRRRTSAEQSQPDDESAWRRV